MREIGFYYKMDTYIYGTKLRFSRIILRFSRFYKYTRFSESLYMPLSLACLLLLFIILITQDVCVRRGGSMNFKGGGGGCRPNFQVLHLKKSKFGFKKVGRCATYKSALNLRPIQFTVIHAMHIVHFFPWSNGPHHNGTTRTPSLTQRNSSRL